MTQGIRVGRELNARDVLTTGKYARNEAFRQVVGVATCHCEEASSRRSNLLKKSQEFPRYHHFQVVRMDCLCGK